MENVRGCFDSARRKLSSCCSSCRCPSHKEDTGDLQSSLNSSVLPTVFENERQPLIVLDSSTRNKETDDDEQKSGCFSNFPCLRRRRRRVRSADSSSNISEVDMCTESDRQLGLEESEEPRPLLRKGPSRSEYKRELEKELRVLKDMLKYHFTNPFHKYKHHGRKPWKLVLSFVKLILATAQLVLFSQSSFGDAQFLSNNLVAFHHLFIKDYNPAEPMLLYKTNDVREQLLFTVEQYYDINNTAIGSYDFASGVNSDEPPPVQICCTGYKRGLINSFNWTYKFDPESVTNCTSVSVSRNVTANETIAKFWNDLGKSPFDRLNTVSVLFRIRTVFLNAYHSPDCIQFDIELEIDNSGHNGIAAVSVTSNIATFSCKGETVQTLGSSTFIVFIILDIVVAIVCVASAALCIRSLIKTYHLAQLAATFFRKYCRRRLRVAEMMGLVNLWFINSMIADVALIAGSIGKLLISHKFDTQYLTWSILLGIGTGLTWASLLRFLGYFQKYNILLVTVKAAMPSILRFMLCTLILYVAFLLCGWAVLGPYNKKFKDVFTTSECLFSLLNGDDMYNTFKLTSSTNQVAVIFCQIYLYVFICLFIYIVLNLFIGLISEMYGAVRMMGKKQWKALYLGKLYHLLDEDEDDDWDDDLIDWHREIQRGRFHSSSSDSSSDEQDHREEQTTRDINISEVI